mgnify:CR=1 FL=1
MTLPRTLPWSSIASTKRSPVASTGPRSRPTRSRPGRSAPQRPAERWNLTSPAPRDSRKAARPSSGPRLSPWRSTNARCPPRNRSRGTSRLPASRPSSPSRPEPAMVGLAPAGCASSRSVSAGTSKRAGTPRCGRCCAPRTTSPVTLPTSSAIPLAGWKRSWAAARAPGSGAREAPNSPCSSHWSRLPPWVRTASIAWPRWWPSWRGPPPRWVRRVVVRGRGGARRCLTRPQLSGRAARATVPMCTRRSPG